MPLSEPVLTPKGWGAIGSLRVGDSVTDPTTGGSQRVIGVFPQGVQRIWKVTCDDGASTFVGAEHLWAYRVVGRKRPGTKHSKQRQFATQHLGAETPTTRWDTLRVGTTDEMRSFLERGTPPRIPLSEPISFTANGRTGKGLVSPYIAGILIGDGHLRGATVTACDNDVRAELIAAGFSPHAELHKDGLPKTYRATGKCGKLVRAWLKNHGLTKCRSWEKFIPSYVFTSSVEYRLHFLQGLMDSGGTADERGRCYFISTSRQLSEGVQALARSLGGKARLRDRQTRFTYKGDKKDGRPSYQVRIWLRRNSAMFRCTKKIERCTDSWNGGAELSREVVSITEVEPQESVCIKVSGPRGLYVTRDFIVTHNTEVLIRWLEEGIQYPGFSGLFLRRTMPQLQGSPTTPVERSYRFFKVRDGIFNDSKKVWTFPNGAMIRFGSMQHENDKHNYDGTEFHRICVERTTPVLMADGSWLAIHQIRVGDYVQTLEGPRAVTRLWNMGRKPVVRVTTPYGSALCSDSHRMLTPFGWVCPSEQRSIVCRSPSASCLYSEGMYQEPYRQHSTTPSDRGLVGAGGAPGQALGERSCLDVSTIDDRSDYAESGDEHLAAERLASWSFPLMLFGPGTQLAQSGNVSELHPHELSHGNSGYAVQYCLAGCPDDPRFCDGPLRPFSVADQGRIPSQAGAWKHNRVLTLRDDQGNTQTHTLDRYKPLHPYTTRPLRLCEDVHQACGEMVRAGEAELMDLTVEEASHFIVSGYTVCQNCVDQVEGFSESQYAYMFSRLRRTKGYPIPCGMRSAANPIGGIWVKRRFVTEEAIQALRGFNARDPSPPDLVFETPTGAMFMPSRVADNPSIEIDEYIERLQSKLGAQLAARLANGDWSVIEGAIIDPGDFRYFRLLGGESIVNMTKTKADLCDTATPPTMLKRFATIDTAGTSKQKAAELRGRPSSWSVCAIWDYCSKLKFLHLRHIWRERVGYTDLKTQIAKVLTKWAVPVTVIENAHHGQPLAADLKKLVKTRIKLAPTKIKGIKETMTDSAKHERAVASGLLSMIAEGRFFLPDIESVAGVSEWLPDFEGELMGWTGLPEQTSDQVDVCSYAAHHVGTRSQPWGGVIN